MFNNFDKLSESVDIIIYLFVFCYIRQYSFFGFLVVCFYIFYFDWDMSGIIFIVKVCQYLSNWVIIFLIIIVLLKGNN